MDDAIRLTEISSSPSRRSRPTSRSAPSCCSASATSSPTAPPPSAGWWPRAATSPRSWRRTPTCGSCSLASEEARLARRAKELHGEAHDAAVDATRDQIVRRDRDDSSVSQFMQAAPGVDTVDTSDLDFEQSVQAVLDVVRAAGPAETAPEAGRVLAGGPDGRTRHHRKCETMDVDPAPPPTCRRTPAVSEHPETVDSVESDDTSVERALRVGLEDFDLDEADRSLLERAARTLDGGARGRPAAGRGHRRPPQRRQVHAGQPHPRPPRGRRRGRPRGHPRPRRLRRRVGRPPVHPRRHRRLGGRRPRHPPARGRAGRGRRRPGRRRHVRRGRHGRRHRHRRVGRPAAAPVGQAGRPGRQQGRRRPRRGGRRDAVVARARPAVAGVGPARPRQRRPARRRPRRAARGLCRRRGLRPRRPPPRRAGRPARTSASPAC